MKVTLTATRYNIIAMMGWMSIVVGLVSALLQYFNPSVPGIYLLAAGLVCGAITVTVGGPIKTVTQHQVELRGDSNSEPRNK